MIETKGELLQIVESGENIFFFFLFAYAVKIGKNPEGQRMNGAEGDQRLTNTYYNLAQIISQSREIFFHFEYTTK